MITALDPNIVSVTSSFDCVVKIKYCHCHIDIYYLLFLNQLARDFGPVCLESGIFTMNSEFR